MATHWIYLPPERGGGWNAAVASLPDSADGVADMIKALDRTEAWARRHLDAFRDAPEDVFGLSRIPMNEGACFGRIASPEGAAEDLEERFRAAFGRDFDGMAPRLLSEEEAQALCGSGANLDSEWEDSGAAWMWGPSGARQEFCADAGMDGGEPSFSVACGFFPPGDADPAWVSVKAGLEPLRRELEKGLRLMQEEEESSSPRP